MMQARTQGGAAVKWLVCVVDCRRWRRGSAAGQNSVWVRMTLEVGWVGRMGKKVDLLWVRVSLAVHVCWVWSDVEVRYRRDLVMGWFRRVMVGVGWIAGVMGW